MPTPIQIQATKLEIPYSLSQLDNKKNEIAALVESLGLTFEGEQNLYNQLIALGIEEIKLGEQYDSIDVTKGAGVAPVSIKLTEHPQVGLSVDTSEGTAIVAVQDQSSLSVTIDPSNDIDVQTKEQLSVTVINPNKYIYTEGVQWGDVAGTIANQTDLVDYIDAEIAAIPVPPDPDWGNIGGTITDQTDLTTYVSNQIANDPASTLDEVTTEGSVTANTIEVGGVTSNGLVKAVADTLPTLEFYAESQTNPTANEDMGSVTFSRLFDNPDLQTLATALYNPFVTRVEADGGTVDGTAVDLRNDLDTLLAGKVATDTARMRVEYTDTAGNMSSDFVFYTTTAGLITEKFRVTKDGNIEVKEALGGVVIRSKNDTPYRILVDNDGRLEATALDAAAPVISGVPTITGLAAITETITAVKASVTSSPALTTSYQWQVSDTGTGGWSNISGATSSSYLIPLEDANKFLRVQQIETNIIGQTTAFSAATSAVIPSLLVSAMVQRLDNFENETYVYDSLVEFDAIEI